MCSIFMFKYNWTHQENILYSNVTDLEYIRMCSEIWNVKFWVYTENIIS